MKHFTYKTIKSSITLFLLVSCSNEWIPSGERVVDSFVNRIELTRAEQIVSARDLDFGIDIFKDITKIEGTDKDMLLSPFCASLAFSMLSAGANGKTHEQIINGLGFKGLEYADMASYYKKLSFGMVSADDKVALSLANAIWAECKLKDDYVSEVRESYNSEVSFLSFSDTEKAAGAINNWTKDKTHEMIKEIVKPYDLLGTAAVLENALYFNSEWQYKDWGTKYGVFSLMSGDTKDCKFFTNGSASSLLSLFSDQVSILKIPYKNAAFNFMIILPPKGKDISKFISSISGEKWYNWSTMCKSNNVYFEIPCFESECCMDGSFESAIRDRGIVLPFSPKADFKSMTDVPVSIGRVVHKTAIKVSEKGTEASAATAIIMNYPSPGPGHEIEVYRFVADRPFIYAIEEASTGTLLFIGTHVR